MKRGNEKCIQNISRKLENKRQHGITRCEWDVNIKIELRETLWEFVDWIHLTQDRDQL
jgi:hypothetical protein